MNRHTRSAAALALVTTAGAVASPAPAYAQEEPDVYCYTVTITAEEAAAGVTNEITCSDDPGEVPFGRLATVARHHDGYGGTPYFDVFGSCSEVVNMSSSDWWNNRISSTDLFSCGTAKHWTGANFTGSNQVVSGGGLHAMNATLNNQTSSIQYA